MILFDILYGCEGKDKFSVRNLVIFTIVFRREFGYNNSAEKSAQSDIMVAPSITLIKRRALAVKQGPEKAESPSRKLELKKAEIPCRK